MKEILRGNRIIIRTYDEADIKPLYEAVRESIAEISLWLPWCHPNYSIEESTKWVMSRPDAWQNGEEYSFVIEEINNGKFLGGVGINHLNFMHGIGNLGYWIRTEEQGKGYALEALKLTAKFGIESLKLNRIEIVMAVDNIQSKRVAEKANAFKECIARDRLTINNVRHNAYVFSIIKQDLKKIL